jgi:hypothetical protein
MMTEESIKEGLSIKFIEAIANYKGFKTNHSDTPDYGTDLSIIEVDSRIEKSKLRYFDTGRELKIQLKATTEKNIDVKANFVSYDLEAKTYNDLVSRMQNVKPLILILFILPIDRNDWLNLTTNELIIKKCAYWYYPEETDLLTENVATKRINISIDNIVTIETIDLLFENYG